MRRGSRGRPVRPRTHPVLGRGCGCDLLTISNPPVTPTSYVNHWLKSERQESEESFTAESARWLAHFAELRIEAIGAQLVVLRKRSTGSPNWFRDESAPASTTGNFGVQILRHFACQDVLEQSDAALLKARWRVAPELQLEQVSVPGPGRWSPRESKITFSEGLRNQYRIDEVMASFLGRLDGKRPLSEVLAALTAEFNTKGNWAGAEAAKKVRQMASAGIIEPAATSR